MSGIENPECFEPTIMSYQQLWELEVLNTCYEILYLLKSNFK